MTEVTTARTVCLFMWFAPERRFIPAITVDDRGPLPSAADYHYARALTAAAWLAGDLGLPLPPHVQRWIPDDEQDDVVAQLRGRGPLP